MQGNEIIIAMAITTAIANMNAYTTAKKATPTTRRPQELATEDMSAKNPTELERLADKADFEDVPESFDMKREGEIVKKGVKTTVVSQKPDETASEESAAMIHHTTPDKDGVLKIGDDIVVTVPQGLVRAKEQPCIRIGDRLLIETKDAHLVTAVVGDVFEHEQSAETDIYEADKTLVSEDEKSCSYGQIENDNAVTLAVWSESKEKTVLEKEGISRIADLGQTIDDISKNGQPEDTAQTTPDTQQLLGAQAFAKAARDAVAVVQEDDERQEQTQNDASSGELIEALAAELGSTAPSGEGDCLPDDCSDVSTYIDWYEKNSDAGTVTKNTAQTIPSVGDIVIMWDESAAGVVESVKDDGFWCVTADDRPKLEWHEFGSIHDDAFITPDWSKIENPTWDTEAEPTTGPETPDTIEDAPEGVLGTWNASETLSAAENWFYVKDTVLTDGTSAQAIEKAGILPGDILADGTKSPAPARRYLGTDDDGKPLWELADPEGNILDTNEWQPDLRRRSIWREISLTGKSNGITSGTQKFIDSCRTESENWANGTNKDQPYKYIDYWEKNVPEQFNPHSWGGQCSEYILWNLANIGLVPGKTMADWDKIRWGGRCELKFIQDHPEYGEIHALDGKEDGCISGYYVPRPGDICIQGHGSHFEMVSEVFDDHWEGYSSGFAGCGPTSHPINPDQNATNHDGYYVFVTVYFDKCLADS